MPPSGPKPHHDAILARLRMLHPRVIDLSLGRMRRILADLDNPERHLPPVIHVAGTNGKGSLIAYLRAILEAAGHRVHVFTSPHLVRFNERIRLAGVLISDQALEAVLEEVEQRNAGQPITEFEVVTAAALLAFSRVPADYLLLETGLGGEFDATNVVDRPVLTAITPVDFDHLEFLGPTLESIAAAKAGIIKPGVACITGPQRPEVFAILRDRAAALGAPLIGQGADYRVEPREEGMLFTDSQGSVELPLPSLPGRHQLANAATAVACIRALPGRGASDDDCRRGLLTVEWPARLQRLRQGPLVDLYPGGELWLDGGHNPHCAAAVADYLRELPAAAAWLIVGMKSNKDIRGFLQPFVDIVEKVIGVPIPDDPNCHSPETVADIARTLGMRAQTAENVASAIAMVKSSRPGVRIFVVGSLYLAGAVLAENS